MQRTFAIMLLTIVVPIIGYLLYVEWIGPTIQARTETQEGPSAEIQEALIASQLQATARAEVWATVTAETPIDEETQLLDLLKV